MKIYHNDTEILDIAVDDSSYRYRAIKGDHNITLYFSLAEHVEIPVGSFCVYQNETYTLEKPESLKMKHSRNFEYTVIFESPQAKAQRFKFRNPADGRLKFSLTAKPIEHLQMFVDNMNQRDSGWTVGQCIDAPEITLSYNHVFCNEALTQMADEVKTECEIVGKQVSLWKVEYNKDNPLPLSYGRGNGFKPGVGRSNYENKVPIEILYTQGSDRNIDASKYGSSELLLPESQQIRFDGVHFEDETGYDVTKARVYVTDADGFSIQREDKALTSQAEDSLDCSEIYPSRIGTVTSVEIVQEGGEDQYNFFDTSIPDALDYKLFRIKGESATIIFQSGELSGREFEIMQSETSITGYDHTLRRFKLVKQEIDGVTMPGGVYIPRVGDTYAVFGIMLPDAYICDNATKSGASWDMFREGVKYLYDNEEQKFTFTGELDGIWAKQDWLNIGGKIKLGGFVQFTDERFQQEGVLVRIIGIKDYINNPHSPEIELSNSTVGRSVSSDLRQIGSNEVLTEDLHKEAIQFTKRRYRDAKETIEMLGEALLDNFTNSINPITVQTMAMLVGDESLQFQFVNNTTNPTPVAHNVVYDTTTKVLSSSAGIIQHLTLGITSISSSHEANEYKYWAMSAFESPTLTDGSKKYYLYARVSKTAQTGVFYMSEEAIAMEGVSGYYHLLIGVLNSEYDGERSYVSLYGFTEVLPGRITTDKIVSSEGTSFWDLLQNIVSWGGKLMYNTQGNDELILNGPLIQTGSGDVTELGAWCGEWNENRRYALGDEVWCNVDGNISSYRYINSVPSIGHAVTDDNYWEVFAKGIKGEKGADGESPVFADLDNEMEGVALNAQGKTTAQVQLVTNVALYFGTTALTLTGISVSGLTTGITESHVLSTGKITFTIANGASVGANVPVVITLTGKYGQVTYTRNLTFTITGVKAGANGQDGQDGQGGTDGQDGTDGADAVIYSILPSVSSVKKNKAGAYSVNDVSCTRYKRVGNGALQTTTDGTLKYKLDNGSEQNYTSAISTGAFNTSLTFLFYIGTTLVDKETVPLIYDGTDGQDGQDGQNGVGIQLTTVTYNTSSSGTTAPVSGWSSSIPSVTPGFYLWTKTVLIYTNGTSSTSYTAARQGLNGSDGQDGVDGKSPACIYRGEYDSTKEYYGTSVRTDVVHYNNRYYIAKATVGSGFSGKVPTNTTYWNDFGASFDSIATGFLFAEETVINKAVVRLLRTAETGARIVAENNVLSMYDNTGALKLVISGDDMGSAPVSSTFNIPSKTHLYSTIPFGNVAQEKFTDVETISVTNNANTVVLPALPINFRVSSDTIQYGTANVYGVVSYVVDGNEDTPEMFYGTLSQYSTTYSAQKDLPSRTKTLSVGSHTIQIKVRLYVTLEGAQSSGTLTYDVKTSSASGIIDYAIQKCEIAKNGFRVMFASNYIAEFVKTGSANSSVAFTIQAGSWGLKVTDTGAYVNRGSGWVAL